MKTEQSSPVLEYSNTRSYSMDDRQTESAEEQQREQAAGPSTGSGPGGASKLSEGVTWAVLSICLGAWAVIGLFLWIPRVLRAVFSFSLALVHSMLTETTAETAGQNLRSAANFYRRGFVAAVDAIRPPVRDPRQPPSKEDRSEGIDTDLLIRETVWAVLVWYVLLWVTGIIRGTPMDIATVDWATLWSGWVEAVWSVPELFQS